MLVDLTPDIDEIDRRYDMQKSLEIAYEYIPQYFEKWKQGTGIYVSSCPFNFSYIEFMEFKGKCNVSPEQSYQLFAPDYHKAQHGIADSIEQIKEYFKEEIEDTNKKYIITLTPVFQDKENKFKGGGWRWHKWGEYIGKLNKKCEYLDDEEFGDDFQYVIVFEIIGIL